MGIGDYLFSKSFKLCLTKYDLDGLWNRCEKIRDWSDDSMKINIIGYTGYHEETFHIFLNEIYKQDEKEFFKIIR